MISFTANQLNQRLNLVSRIQAYDQKNFRLQVGLLLLTILTLSFIYIFQVNILATNGYRISILEQQKQTAIEINKQLEIQLLDLRLLVNQQKVLHSKQFVENQSVEYYTVPSINVAIVK